MKDAIMWIVWVIVSLALGYFIGRETAQSNIPNVDVEITSDTFHVYSTLYVHGNVVMDGVIIKKVGRK